MRGVVAGYARNNALTGLRKYSIFTGFVTGHDFSRADKMPQNRAAGFSPCHISGHRNAFSGACQAPLGATEMPESR
jgi:hypothetical protein